MDLSGTYKERQIAPVYFIAYHLIALLPCYLVAQAYSYDPEDNCFVPDFFRISLL